MSWVSLCAGTNQNPYVPSDPGELFVRDRDCIEVPGPGLVVNLSRPFDTIPRFTRNHSGIRDVGRIYDVGLPHTRTH